MGIKHINKAIDLKLPSTTKLVLLALAQRANNDDDTCFPGLEHLREKTGFSEKTIIRSIRLLNGLGLVDTEKRMGTSNMYTLYLTGGLEAWEKYLESKADVIKGIKKENQSKTISSESIYKYTINNKYKNKDKDDLNACEVSHAGQKLNLKAIAEEDNKELPPGRRTTPLQRCWELSVSKYHKGLKVKLTSDDKFAIDGFYKKYETELPLLEFVEFIVANWHKFVQTVKKHPEYHHSWGAPIAPSLSFLWEFRAAAIKSFANSKKEAH